MVEPSEGRVNNEMIYKSKLEQMLCGFNYSFWQARQLASHHGDWDGDDDCDDDDECDDDGNNEVEKR